ncbi:MAG: L,D-transpeptidase family protein [Planctomycetota bacterium]|jgi:L,D-transpeptidase ErfK/SrfK
MDRIHELWRGSTPLEACLAGLAGLLLAVWVWPSAAAEPRHGTDMIGELLAYQTVEDDTLLHVARDNGLGFVELIAANPGLDPWIPPPGSPVLLPTAHLLPDAPREGIVINLAELRLYYFPEAQGPAVSFPLGIGQAGWETPVGRTEVVRKRFKPSWSPPDSIRAEAPHLPAVVPPGPANPLGDHAFDLGWPKYVIHGTNNPLGIGRRVSHGCIRLYPEDIAWLFARVAVGTPVLLVDQPAKIGWSGRELYLEVHPSQSQVDELEAQGRFTPEEIVGLEARLEHAAGDQAPRLDWSRIHRVASERRGFPVRVTR